MSCFLSTTYWVFLFHILHVKYGIKRPNSLSFFFIILASTRHNPSTGGRSSPDITLATSDLASRLTWTVAESIGSDHLPIHISLEVAVPPLRRGKGSFNFKKADWEGFRKTLDAISTDGRRPTTIHTNSGRQIHQGSHHGCQTEHPIREWN